MTEDELRRIFEEARGQTSAGEAELTFLAMEDEVWVLLVKAPDSDELAIQIQGGGEKTPGDIRQEIRGQLKRLF